MAEEKTLFEKLCEVGEENLTRFVEEIRSSPVFAEGVDHTLRNAAETREKFDQNIAALLSLLNLPSKADYNRLVEQVETIHGSVVNLNIKLDRLLAAQKKKTRRTAKKKSDAKR